MYNNGSNTLLRHGQLFQSTPVGTQSRSITGVPGDPRPLHAAFVPFDNPSNWRVSSSANGRGINVPRTYMSRWYERVEGLPVVTLGSGTGRQVGQITHARVSVIKQSPARVLTNMIRLSARAGAGDSGGPAYVVDSSGRHLLIGIIQGGAAGVHTNVSNIQHIEYYLSVRVITEERYW